MERDTITVLYEDEDVLVINKPAGFAVHEDGRTEGPVVTDWIRAWYPSLVGVGETMRLQNGVVIDRPGIVHRLDRDTSGVLVIAKTADAFTHLKQEFQARSVEKLYHAVTWGECTRPVGTIDRPIGRSRKDFRLWTSGPTAGGKMRSATTRWTALAVGNGFSYLAVEPKTGRTHQIRVHLKGIGHPVVCDTRYAPKKGCALGFTRLALHAHTLVFTHPRGERMQCEAPPEDVFLEARRYIEQGTSTKEY